MERSMLSEEQAAFALRGIQGGTPPAMRLAIGVSEATMDLWKKKFAHLGVE